MATVYRKSAKGQDEIEKRTHRLLPRLRTALILVDGRRDADELAKLIPGDPVSTLESLLADGFIERLEVAARPVPAAVPVTAAPLTATAPAAAATPATRPAPLDPKAFETHRRAAVRALNDLVGPVGETAAIKIEKARNWDDLLPALELAQRTIGNIRGAAAADEFKRAYVTSPPG